jgi:hypothetical protein
LFESDRAVEQRKRGRRVVEIDVREREVLQRGDQLR